MAQIPNTDEWKDDYDLLKKYAIIGVSVLGGVLILILCLVLGLCIWNCILCKRINKMNSLTTFKLSRPKLISKKDPAQKPPQFVVPKPDYVNPGFTQDSRNQSNRQYSTDNNPIAIRSKTSFDNGNFSFGGGSNAVYPHRESHLNKDIFIKQPFIVRRHILQEPSAES